MEFKTTSLTKNLLNQAAALDGLDLTSFVLAPAIEKARKVLQDHNELALRQEAQMNLVTLLTTSTPPTGAMRKLMELPDFPERSKK